MWLRSFTVHDVQLIVALDDDPGVLRFINGGRSTPREVAANEMLPRFMARYGDDERFGYWVAIDKSNREFLGWFALHPPGREPSDVVELGYRLRRAAWGRGFATEGAQALVRGAFTELAVARVWAQTMTVNTGSRRVLEKSGLVHVRTFHHDWPEVIAGSEQGDVEYSIERSAWLSAGQSTSY